jgi:lactate dehydrogenase-like 2-hydroxyacid dehydrogenase
MLRPLGHAHVTEFTETPSTDIKRQTHHHINPLTTFINASTANILTPNLTVLRCINTGRQHIDLNAIIHQHVKTTNTPVGFVSVQNFGWKAKLGLKVLKS